MAKYNVRKLKTTDGNKYVLFRGDQRSLSHKTYYSKKSNADKKAKRLNDNL